MILIRSYKCKIVSLTINLLQSVVLRCPSAPVASSTMISPSVADHSTWYLEASTWLESLQISDPVSGLNLAFWFFWPIEPGFPMLSRFSWPFSLAPASLSSWLVVSPGDRGSLKTRAEPSRCGAAKKRFFPTKIFENSGLDMDDCR